MIPPPPPGKKPFGHPIPMSALEHFCHPTVPEFQVPVTLPTGETAAASGYIAIRTTIPLELTPAATPAFIQRFEKLPWSTFDRLSHPSFDKDWKPLEDAALTLFRFGPKPLWHHTPNNPVVPTNATPVRVGDAAIAPLACLQLLFRLPRAQILTSNRLGDPIFCRFNGGRAIIGARKLTQAKFTILHFPKHPA